MQIEVKSSPETYKGSTWIQDLWVVIYSDSDIIPFTNKGGQPSKKYKTIVLVFQNGSELLEMLGYEEELNQSQIKEQFATIKKNVRKNKQEAYPMYRKELSKDQGIFKRAIRWIRSFLQRRFGGR